MRLLITSTTCEMKAGEVRSSRDGSYETDSRLGFKSYKMNSKDLHWRSEDLDPVQVGGRKLRRTFALPVSSQIYHRDVLHSLLLN